MRVSAREFNEQPGCGNGSRRTMEALHLTIEGMTCEHCVRAVDGRLRRTPGVQVDNVVVGAADLHFDAEKLSVDDIADLIADEGYTAFRE
jgi:copper chaperone